MTGSSHVPATWFDATPRIDFFDDDKFLKGMPYPQRIPMCRKYNMCAPNCVHSQHQQYLEWVWPHVPYSCTHCPALSILINNIFQHVKLEN